MDFDLSEEQQAVYDLAGQILADQLTAERFKSAGPIDRALWQSLADAGLLGISLPAAYGGGDQDFMATALLLEQAGHHAAPVPLLATLVYGALPIAEFGSAAQKEALLPGVCDGTLVLTAALVGPVGAAGVTVKDGVLSGVRTCVPAGAIADRILVPAGDGVYVVDASAPGVTVTPLVTTTASPDARIELDGASGELLGAAADIVPWITTRATSGACAVLAGACKAAVAMTAEYAKTREQFERPIATFQAVAQRIADAYIDAEGVHLTARQAAWRLSSGLPAEEEVAIAKYWASEAGQRVVHAAQHVHGGTGVDRDYPVHRYFLLAKQLELTLGGTTASLLRLGARLAAEPAVV